MRRTGKDLLGLVTLRRRESSLEGYVIRLFCVGMIVVVLPVLKLVQLGPVGFALALVKVALGAALVAALLALVLFVEVYLQRRKTM
jgi:hypothetical protein